MDLDGFLEQTATGDGFGRDSSRARCSRKTQDKFAIASMAKKLLHRCIRAHARVHMHFFAESVNAFTGVVEHHARASEGVYVRQML